VVWLGTTIEQRMLRFVGLLALILLGTACQVSFDVVIDIEADGSGNVETTTTMDAETTAALLDLEAGGDGLPLQDLALAGWLVGRPAPQNDGSTVITASKEFGTTEQLTEIIDELNGPNGPFGEFKLFRQRSFAEVDYQLEGTIDTSAGLDGFADSALTEALGMPISALADRYGAKPSDVTVRVEVSLPGQAQGEPLPGVIDISDTELRAEWLATMGDSGVTEIRFQTGTRKTEALVLRGVAVVAGVLAAIVALSQILRILLPERRKRKPAVRRKLVRGPLDAGESTKEIQKVPHSEAEKVDDGPTHTVLALAGIGVLYKETDPIRNLIVPFAREKGSKVTVAQIESRYRSLQLGRTTTSDFWRSIDIRGLAGELDSAYLARQQLMPGVIRYLRRQRDSGIRVACITNDAGLWASKLRARHSLENLIDPWVVSSTVGDVKPSRPIFEVLRRTTGEEVSKIMIMDVDLDVLDFAQNLGYSTTWFSPSGLKEDSRGHPITRGFEFPDEDHIGDVLVARPPQPEPQTRPSL